MNFRTTITSGKEVLFVGHERGEGRTPADWLESGRWRIAVKRLEAYLDERLRRVTFGTSVECFVFCFEIADFELWGDFFKATATYTSYRPKSKEMWSVGQLRWSEVKDLSAMEQLIALRAAVQTAIVRVGEKRRKPRDFAYMELASAVDRLLAQAPLNDLVATPAA